MNASPSALVSLSFPRELRFGQDSQRARENWLQDQGGARAGVGISVGKHACRHRRSGMPPSERHLGRADELLSKSIASDIAATESAR